MASFLVLADSGWDPTIVAAIIGAAAALLVALIAVGGTIYQTRQSRKVEREKDGEGQRTVALTVPHAQFISRRQRKRGKYLFGSEEFPFDEGMLALLNLQKEQCQRKNVAVNTSHLLLALLEIRNGAAQRALNDFQPDFATKLHSQLEQYIVQLPNMSGVKPYSQNFQWEDLPAVQKAWQWAQKDGGKQVTEKHLLLGILEAEDSGTLQSLRRRLGGDFPRLVQTVQNTPNKTSTPEINSFLQGGEPC